MNRQTKRMLQRQGQVGPDGAPARRQPPPRPTQRPTRERTGPVEFTRQVRGELRKVAWPTRPEVVNYSVIVLITVVILTAMIFGFDWVFAKFVFFLFKR